MEVNKDWRCVPTESTVWVATAPWRETRNIQVSNNTTCQQSREHQIGGTILMAFDEVSHRISDRRQDIRGLGRWSGMLELNGIGGLKTTIITAYCPVHSPGLGGCYTQHLTYMSMHCSDPETSSHFIPEHIKCSRQLFGYNLCKFIEKQIEPGHQIIVMGDFNSEYVALQEWMLYLDCSTLLKINMDTSQHRKCIRDQQTHWLIASLHQHRSAVHFVDSLHWKTGRWPQRHLGRYPKNVASQLQNPTTYAS